MRLLLLLLSLIGLNTYAQTTQYEQTDSIKIVQLLDDASKQPSDENMMIFFARQLKGIPYVAKTLERNKEERLVVNTRELDCTTYVENVLALYLCHKNNKLRFEDFCEYLRLVRYKNGEISYINRLHYFSYWIEDNVRMGYVKHIEEKNPPFSGRQKLALNFMSTHPSAYPMITNAPEGIKQIRNMEKELSGNVYRYIPKDKIQNTKLLRSCIKDGDILAMLTNRKGLDTSHIGIAVWKDDGLHLLNASSIRKKVVEESMTLQAYMQRQRSQIGIRVVRCN